MIDILPLGSFLIAERQPKLMTSTQGRQFNHKICLPPLDAKVRADYLRRRSSGGVGHLPRPGWPPPVSLVVILADSATEGLRHKCRNLRRHLVKADDCHVVGSGLPAPRFRRHIAPRYENCTVTIDAAREISAEGFFHKANSNDCPQCHQLGTPHICKQLGSRWAGSASDHAGDPEAWPDDLRVREFPREHQPSAA